MYVIGISAFYHDSSVCLFKNGELIFSCEEEKFTGIKHDSSFPKTALSYILKKYRIKRSEIECVCYYENPKLKLERVKRNIKKIFFNNPLHSIKTYLKIKKNISVINYELNKISDNIFFSTHHESHVYYSFYSSDFKDSMVLSVDGVGEIDTMSMGIFRDNKLMYTSLSEYPHSLGLFYSAMTSFLGFKPNEGEYKVMGLASYGDPNQYIEKIRKLVTVKNPTINCNMDYFCWNKSDKIMFNHKLSEFLNIEPRLPNEKITKNHEDLAAAVQLRYEELLFKILKTISVSDDTTNLCLGGGCAYNGSANGKIINSTPFKQLWIPPAPSDAGSAIGACINYFVKNNKLKNRITKNPFLGPNYEYDYQGYFDKISTNKKYKFVSDYKMIEKVAQELKDGKVVGWFQGKCEFGARALGNRSILANPTIEGMKDRINKVIKKREGFRPFAPMVMRDKQKIYFDMTQDIPYMNQVVPVKEEYRNILKAVTHVDGTARVQTVPPNTKIHQLLYQFEKLTGYPILLNTSFNVKDKTMVLTPQDAIDTFYDTEMDILVFGNYIIYK